MQPDKDQLKENAPADSENKEETRTVDNPFKPGETREISQDQLEGEQEFKEALTERD